MSSLPLLRFKKRSLLDSLITSLTFFYFFTSCADKLNFHLLVFKGKANNLIAMILFVLLFVKYRRIALHKLLAIPIGLICFSIFISSTMSPFIMRSMGYNVVYLIELVLYFLLSYNLMFHLEKELVFKLFFLGAFFVGAHAFLQLFLSLFNLYEPFVSQYLLGGLARPSSFAYEPSFYALYMSAFAMYFNFFFLFSKEPLSIYDKKNLLLFNFYLLLSTSTGAFFSYFFMFFLALLFILFFKTKWIAPYLSKRVLSVMGVFAIFSLIMGVVFNDFVSNYFFKFFRINFATHHSFADRWNGIVNSIQVFLEKPLFGVGIGGIGPYLYYKKNEVYQQTMLSLKQCEIYDPMNVATELLASLGIFGVIAFSFLFFSTLSLLKTLLRSTCALKSKREVLCLFFSLLVVLLTLQFSQGLFRNYIWIHFGLLCGLIHRELEPKTTTEMQLL